MNASQFSIDLIVTSDARRGAEVFGRRLTDGLRARGWDAELVSLVGSRNPGVPTSPLTEDRPRRLGLEVARALRKRVRARRPALVFANGGATLRQTSLGLLSFRGAPPLVYGSIGEPAYWLRGRMHRFLQRLMVGRCAHVTAVSEATKAGLVETGVDPDKITVVYPGVEEAWFDAGRSAREPGALRVLFAGSLSREKDPGVAVATMARLENVARLRMAGDGPLRPYLESAAGPNVEVLGPVADMSVEFDRADVLLLTSLTEGLPGVAVEAAARGLPVVATSVGGTGEAVVDGLTGILVAPGDVDGFANALIGLAADESHRLALGDAGRARARDLFAMSESIDGYEQVFEALVS